MIIYYEFSAFDQASDSLLYKQLLSVNEFLAKFMKLHIKF